MSRRRMVVALAKQSNKRSVSQAGGPSSCVCVSDAAAAGSPLEAQFLAERNADDQIRRNALMLAAGRRV